MKGYRGAEMKALASPSFWSRSPDQPSAASVGRPGHRKARHRGPTGRQSSAPSKAHPTRHPPHGSPGLGTTAQGQPHGEHLVQADRLPLNPQAVPQEQPSSTFCSVTPGTRPRLSASSLPGHTHQCLVRWAVTSRLRAAAPNLQINQTTRPHPKNMQPQIQNVWAHP